MKVTSSLLLPLLFAALAATQTAAHMAKKCSLKHHHKSTFHKGHPGRAHHPNSHSHPLIYDDSRSGSGTKGDAKDTYRPSKVPSKVPSTEKPAPATTHTSPKRHSLTPNGIKAGLAGGEALDLLQGKVGWLNTWTARPYEGTKLRNTEFATMCYGFGESGNPDDGKRFEEFKKVKVGQYAYVIGPNEIDFKGSASAGRIEPKRAAMLWDQHIAKHGTEGGSVLVSPSCATQLDENWMGPFLKAVKTKPDLTNVHVFSDEASFIPKVLEHYRKLGLPMWVTEFACINFNKKKKCSKEETVQFIYEAVKIFENDPDVMAYSYADADNGPHCHLSQGGKLTASGIAYRNAISQFSKRDLGFAMARRDANVTIS